MERELLVVARLHLVDEGVLVNVVVHITGSSAATSATDARHAIGGDGEGEGSDWGGAESEIVFLDK